ncbi:MAG: UDP-N-acetylmuramate--L-alanine ligase [Tepidisphaeraceae bacterium]|jgi:UDP-N-acetylmuramate--alanine ligase
MDAALVLQRTESAASQFRGKRVHFIGAGGTGMSGLARMLIDAGAVVSGSEPNPGATTFELIRRGAKISRDQAGQLLDGNIDLVVRTAAVPDNNPEMLAARALGLPTIKYAQLLGRVMSERFGIAVAGTHGKSTTTSMISFALLQCGADPSFVIGATVPQLGGGSRSGRGTAFVAEACEYDRSFHNLHPRIAVITNIEPDHLDCYKDLDDIIASFHDFAAAIPPDGLIIAGDDPPVIRALRGVTARVELAGLSGAPGQAWTTRLTGVDAGCYRGEISYNQRPMGTLRLSVAGRHNLINATMAAATAHATLARSGDGRGDPTAILDAISRFAGADRRMSLVGQCNGAAIVDDYGHHPTEIRATLTALRERYAPKRLLCIFQPHQHSRTRFLLEDFAASFELADQVIVPDIYFVRDSQAERQRISSIDLVQRLVARGQTAIFLPQFSAIVDYVRNTAVPGDLIVTMGAGNVWEISRDLSA